MALSSAQPGSMYRRQFLVLYPGDDEFHELVHFWGHVGTTFGAFQLIGLHIDLKAIRAVLYKMVRAFGSVRLPLVSEDADLIDEELMRERAQKALRRGPLPLRYERPFQLAPLPIREQTGRLVAEGEQGVPLLPVSPRYGIPLGAIAVGELHNLALRLIRNDRPLKVSSPEKEVLEYAHELCGDDAPRQLAIICDWALMSPNPNIVKGEVDPGRRLLLALDEIDIAARKKKHWPTDYVGLSNWISEQLGYQSLDEVMGHYPSFINLAHEMSQVTTDAKRNRLFYSLIESLLREAQAIRRESPDAFAFPHEHEAELRKRLPPAATIRDGRLKFRDRNTADLLRDYMNTAVLAIQALEDGPIICRYRFLGCQTNCKPLQDDGGDESRCLEVPSRLSCRDCIFSRVWTKLNLKGLSVT
jgi:hypothetical protein